jgi:hypothetical protein
MLLGNDFLFSANNLQDFLDCPRRFELKYILKQNWPGVISLPVQEMEYKIQIGSSFHKVAHQYLSGIPAADLNKSIDDSDVKNWFATYLEFIGPYLNHLYFSEFAVTTPFGGSHLIAVFDFISFQNNKNIFIGDWKTTSHRPKKEVYSQSIQSVLYSFIAFETRSHIFPGSDHLNQEDFSLKYFFPAFPEETITLEFNSSTLATNQAILLGLIREISNKEPGSFEKTTNEKRCAYCQYRSLCERGIQAGKLDNEEVKPEIDTVLENLDFDQIEEIPF